MRKRLIHRMNLKVNADGSVPIYSSFDIVGNIAIIKLPSRSTDKAQECAKTIMTCNSGIKTVLLQQTKVSGQYRLRNLIWVAGENKTCTTHKEHGCTFSVDLESSYFSPRLSGERLRISKLVEPSETIVNMFAGVGCFSIVIAKHVPTAKVYSIDINLEAVKFMEQNIHANKLSNQVVPLLGDAKELIEARLQGVADRVLMPLPEKALEYLPAAVLALKPKGGWIHCHCFEHAAKTEDSLEKAKDEISQKLCSIGATFELPFARIIRPVGPNWHHTVVDVHVQRAGKF